MVNLSKFNSVFRIKYSNSMFKILKFRVFMIGLLISLVPEKILLKNQLKFAIECSKERLIKGIKKVL